MIGGGATGLGVALDSVTRGYKTLLLEQVDFAKGTSSRSTKLVHGGVRYLEQFNFDLVREALHERGLLAKNASHLFENQTFVVPSYKWWAGIYYTLGLKLYDLMAGKLSLGDSEHISAEETLKRLPTIRKEHLRGGVTYQDGQFDDSRLALNLAQTCIDHGATVLNYCQVEDLLKNESGSISGVLAKDMESNKTYKLDAKVVVNATGVFTDEILKMDHPGGRKLIKPSQGVHLVFDRSMLASDDALMIPKTSDGRILFAVPWHNRVIVGTTDTPLDSHSLEPQALEKEVDFILETFNRFTAIEVTKKDIKSIYAGLRPLAAPKDKSEKTKEISRSHKIFISKNGLVSITGGKWTTYRRMAQDTIDKAISIGKLPKKACKTEDLKIHGSQENNLEEKNSHLYLYGSDAAAIKKIIAENPILGERLHPDLYFFKAEVVWAVRNEMARTIDDVLARRVRALFLDAKAAMESAPIVAKILAEELRKDKAWKKEQLKSFQAIAENYLP